MASRRRFTRRRFGRRKQDIQYAWSRNVFATNLVEDTTEFVGQILLTPTTWGGDTTAFNKQIVVRRIVADFCVTADVNFASDEQDASAIFSALWVEDEDDVDTQLINSAASGTLLQEQRFLWTGLQGIVIINNAGGDVGTLINYPPTTHIDWKGKLKLRQNQNIILGHQLQSTLDPTTSSVTARTFSQILVEVA